MRHAWLDNAKGILIFLVVLGHLISSLNENHSLLRWSFLFIYSFHMPCFVFLSGTFAETRWSLKLFKRIVRKIVWPYFLFQVLYLFFDHKLFHNNDALVFEFTRPYWLLWYLMSLIFWYALLPLFSYVRWPFLWALVIGIGAGAFQEFGYNLSLSRTLTFLPFFVLGSLSKTWLTSDPKFSKLHYSISLVFFSLLGILIAMHLRFDVRWMWGSFSFYELGADLKTGLLLRSFLTFLAIFAIFAFLILVSQKQSSFRNMGTHSLYAYVFHGFLMKLVTYFHLFDRFPFTDTVWLLLSICVSLIITRVFTSRSFVKTFQYFLDPLKILEV